MKQILALMITVSLLNAAVGRSLTDLYNSKVVRAERWHRPLASSVGWNILKNIAYHCGVVVTLANGERWLVHKGNEYGVASETVVVSTSYMGSNWTRQRSKGVSISTVSDYVKAGGKRYSLLFDNCINACNRMMELP